MQIYNANTSNAQTSVIQIQCTRYPCASKACASKVRVDNGFVAQVLTCGIALRCPERLDDSGCPGKNQWHVAEEVLLLFALACPMVHF